MLFLPTTESLDFPPSQKHFKPEMFTNIIPAHPCQCKFASCMCKTLCFHALAKSFQIEDIQICYAYLPLKAQIRQY